MLLWIEQIVEKISRVVWGPATILLFLLTGIWFTILSRGMQLTRFKLVFKNTLGSLGRSRHQKQNGISPFQAMSTALAGTMGVGNLTGIAAAMSLGGPGAIFWMWVSAFFGMMTKYAEVLLAVKFRRQKADGSYYGGPMYYMQDGLGARWMAVLFCVLCVASCVGGGNMTQSNAISMVAAGYFGLPGWVSGLFVCLCIGLVIIGGIRRIAAVTEWVIPFLTILYLVSAVVALFLRRAYIPAAFASIFSAAFSTQSAVGGAVGYGVSRAVRFGIARGIFTNEAGLGSAPIAHAAADAKHPAAQGLWGVFEVFADTLVVCTLTALVILTSGVAEGGFTGAGMTAEAFSAVLGPFGGWMVAFSLIFFAIAAILGWSFYGEQSLVYLLPGRKKVLIFYRVAFLCCCFMGCVLKIDLVWALADIFNAMMAAPNLLALLCLSDVVYKTTWEYLEGTKYFVFKNSLKKKAG